MRFRDRLRVTQKIKKGTSRNRRRKTAILQRVIEGILDVSGAKEAMDEAIMDMLIHGQCSVKTEWDGDKVKVTRGAIE